MSTDILPSWPDHHSLLYRLSYTPLTDAMRGRWTASLDYRRAVSAAGLPTRLDVLVRTVVEMTGLGKVQKCKVARNLAAHFREALDTGATPDTLIASFGDPAARAKQIRREVNRQHSLIYRAFCQATAIDARQVVAAAHLPVPLNALILKVVNKTRLWPKEKVDVARELIAHLRDGLNSGRDAEQLITAFGDLNVAAKLIRRSKKRKRPIFYRGIVRMFQASCAMIAVLLVIYTGLILRFYSGTPTISKNYADQLNSEIAAIPEQDRAWPLYRQAYDAVAEMSKEYPRVAPHLPPGKAWTDTYAAICQADSKAVGLYRQAAARPRLGALLVLTDPEVKILQEWYRFFPHGYSTTNFLRLRDAIIPKCAILCQGAELLLMDAYTALARKDSPRLRDDITALIGMGGHLLEIGGVTAELSALLNIVERTEDIIGHVLWESPELLSDDEWRSISVHLAAVGGGRFRIDTAVDRLELEDLVQRAYTDNGHGDGRLAGPEAYAYCIEWLQPIVSEEHPQPFGRMVAPVIAILKPSRRDTLARVNELLGAANRMQETPLWLWQKEFDTRKMLGMLDLRTGLADYLQVALGRGFFHCEAATQRRDATLVAIALERYRRESGSYPASLEVLCPRYMPTVPPDRYDGKAIKYKLDRGRPRLYSIGADRVDDGGRVPEGANKRDANWWASEWIAPGDVAEWNKCKQRRGDWVLWPPVDY